MLICGKKLSYSKLQYARGLAITLFSLCSWTLSSGAFGLELDPDAIRGKDKKNSVSVLQNRYFLKSMRPELGLVAGSMLNEAYTDTGFTGFRLGLFFNEWIGVEIQSLDTSVSESEDAKALKLQKFRPVSGGDENTRVSPTPEVNAVRSITEASIIYAPFYGKMNLMDGFIVYTDLYATLGLGQVSTDQGEKSSVNFGGGQRFYFGKSWSFRLEFKLRAYDEERGGRPSSAEALGVDFGLSYFFL